MSKDNKKSFCQLVADLQNKLREDGVQMNNHILFGLEVNEYGEPCVIVHSLQTGGYTGLGMIQGMEIMLEKAKNDIESGFRDIITERADIEHEKQERANKQERKNMIEDIKNMDIPKEVLEKAAEAAINRNIGPQDDEEIVEIIQKYKGDIIKALVDKDNDRLEEIREKMTAELKKVKGADFNPEFVFGLDNDEDFSVRDKDKNEFDPKNTKKYF